MLAFTAVIATLTALVIALLAVPVAFVVDARREDALEADWRVRWLFGLVDVKAEGGRAARPAKAARKPERRRRGSARMGLAVVRTRGLVLRVGRLMAALFRQIRFEEFRLRVAFGFDDPADTGMVYGCVSPLLLMVQRRGLDVECHPLFPDAGLRGALRATASIRPLSVIGVLIAFLLSPPVIRAARSAWRARR